MTRELKKLDVEIQRFLDRLTFELKDTLQQDLEGTKEAKILRAAEKLYQLHAKELATYQGKGLLISAVHRNAMDLVEALLLMGFDNTSLMALLSRVMEKNFIASAIKKKDIDIYLQIVIPNPVDYHSLDLDSSLERYEHNLLLTHEQYKNTLASIFNFMVQEEVNKHLLPPAEKNRPDPAVIISDYIEDKQAFLVEMKIRQRHIFLKPLIDYCNSHFLDSEARHILKTLLANKRVLSTDVEHELDILLENPAHWGKPYSCFLLLSRINTQKETHNALSDGIKRQATTATLHSFKILITAHYLQEYKSYQALFQSYLALQESHLKLYNTFKTQVDYIKMGVNFSIAMIGIQVALMVWALFYLGITMPVYFAGLSCLGLLGSLFFGVLGSPTNLRLFDFVNDPLLPCDALAPNAVLEEDIAGQFAKLKEHYEAVQSASAKLKSKYRTLQHHECLAQNTVMPIQESYNQQFNILVGFAAFSSAALALGVVSICLFNPLPFIGLAVGGAGTTLLAVCGLFKRAQYRLSNPAVAIAANQESVPMTEMALGNVGN